MYKKNDDKYIYARYINNFDKIFNNIFILNEYNRNY